MSHRKTIEDSATSILRSVPSQNAFFFYRSIGSPTGAAAHSLSEFLGLLGSIEESSIKFHLGRGDFENWIKMLGDQNLARQVSALKEKKLRSEQLRLRLIDTVKSRLDQLQHTPMRAQV